MVNKLKELTINFTKSIIPVFLTAVILWSLSVNLSFIKNSLNPILYLFLETGFSELLFFIIYVFLSLMIFDKQRYPYKEALYLRFKSSFVFFVLLVLLKFLSIIFILNMHARAMILFALFFRFLSFVFFDFITVLFLAKQEDLLKKRKESAIKDFLVKAVQANIFYLVADTISAALIGSSFLRVVFSVFLFSFKAIDLLLAFYDCLSLDKKDKRVYLISPLWGGKKWGLISFFMRPYPPVFAILRTYLDKSWQIIESNSVLYDDYQKQGKTVAAISCVSSNAYRAYELAKRLRKKGIYVVLGGVHSSVVPQEAALYADTVIVGDAEDTWPEFIKDFNNGKAKKLYLSSLIKDDLNKQSQAVLDLPPYLSQYCLEAVRGCKYDCEFCSVPKVSRGKFKKRSISDMISLMDHAAKFTRLLVLRDNNIWTDPQYSRELFKALRSRRLKWTSASSIDIGLDEQALDLAKKSGLSQLLIGYELLSEADDTKSSRKFRYAKDYIALSKTIKQKGISIKGGFIFALNANVSFAYLLNILKMFFKINPNSGSCTVLTPLPGTKLYDDFLAEGSIANLNWKSYDLTRLVFKPSMNIFYFRTLYYLSRYSIFLLATKMGRIVSLEIIIVVLLIIRFFSVF